MQAAEELQRRLRAAEGPKPAQAVAESLSALNALAAMHMWPGQLDPISEQQVQDVRRRWARIQRRARAQSVLTQATNNAALTGAIGRATARFQAEVRRLAYLVLRTEMSMPKPRRPAKRARPRHPRAGRRT